MRSSRLLGAAALIVSLALATVGDTELSAATARLGTTAGTAAGTAGPGASGAAASSADPTGMGELVPEPVSVEPNAAASYQVTANTVIHADAGSAAAGRIGDYLAGILDPSTRYRLAVDRTSSSKSTAGITLLLSGAPSSVGTQGYTLDVTDSGVVIRANRPAGLFAGVQTLRQMLPARVEAKTAQPGPWTVPGGEIVDYPRLSYRGAMLDVSRHFFTVAQVEQYIDQLALYKINYLHLHLSDDEGWRIAINGWPALTSVGAATEAGGGAGGYYTQAQYRQIVAYAAARYVTIVPEIDMPGHFTAALASYGGLGCSGTAPPVDTRTGTLGNSICTTAPIAKTFIDDVIGQLAALTPGPYISIGGDEADGVSPDDYATFMTWAQQDVDKHGKTAVGWDAILNSTLAPSTVAEYWGATSASTVATAADKGTRIIMAPSANAYLDQKYNASTVIGLTWANRIDMQTAYGWDPTAYVPGVPASAIIGIEAPLWTETADTFADIDYLAFPRITSYAELGWSPESVTAAPGAFAGFAARVAAQGPRWDELGITYYHSTQIPWPTGPTGPTGTIVSEENNTCLDTAGHSSADGARVQIDACAPATTGAATAAADQQWTAASNGTLLDDGRCLGVADAAPEAGSPVELRVCDGGANQEWRAENGELVNPVSGLCLDVASGTDTPGSALETADCDDTRPQWFALPAGGYGAGPTGPVSSGSSGECLDANRGLSGSLAAADLYSCDATAAQNWSVESDGTIQALGECLTSGGTEVDLDTCNGDGAQQWRWSSNGTYGESLTNQQSGLCLADPGGATGNGTRLELDACDGSLAQVWRLP